MPRQIGFSDRPFRWSIIEFDPALEEIFLTYTEGRHNGPKITRTGMSPPYMQYIKSEMPDEITTNDIGQRVGSWLIQESLRDKDYELIKEKLKKAQDEFKKKLEDCLSDDAKKELNSNDQKIISDLASESDKAFDIFFKIEKPSFEQTESLKASNDKIKEKFEEVRRNYIHKPEKNRVRSVLDNVIKYLSSQSDFRFFIDYLNDLESIDAHDKSFITKYKNCYEIVGQQGCGDLTMNLWNVAYIKSPITNNEARFIYLFDEPLHKRTYSCLLKWTSKQEKTPKLTIEDVRFNPYATNAKEMVFTKDKKVTKDEMEDISWKPSGDDIEFAVYGKQVIRDGKIVEINRITGEFSDLRHLFRMPNLNPKYKLHIDDRGYPRYYFGKNQNDNVWFGEAQLLEHPNEQRAACCGPIFLSRLYRGMGASVEQIRGAMGKEGYKEINDTREPLKEGEFRFVQDDDSLVEVYFNRNKYGWTMIGLSKYGILCLASQGNPNEGIGYKLEDAAKELIDIGANSALLIDEGDDVFQIAKVGHEDKPKIRTYESGELDIFIPSSKEKVDDKNRYITILKRNRLRATFIFAKKKDDNDGNNGDSPVQKDELNHNADTRTIADCDQK